MTIPERIEGSKYFQEIWELADEAIAALTPAGVDRFYELLREKVNAHFPPKVDPVESPMTDKQVEAFANSRMTFGRNVGEKIADISFGYLIWLAEEKDEFKRDLRRYLKHPKVQQEVRRFYDEQGGGDDESVSTED